MPDKSEMRKELEARAENVGLDFPHNLGDAKLEERVTAAEAAQADQAGGGEDAGGDTSPASTAPEVNTYEIVGPKQGRRRAGRRFGVEPVIVPADELSEDDLAALEADPLITVVFREAGS